MLQQLVGGKEMGEGAQFAALAERLRVVSSDFDGLIAEVAGQTDADAELVSLNCLVPSDRFALRRSNMRQDWWHPVCALMKKARWREIMQLQEDLKRGGRGAGSRQ
jgi:DNA primase